MKITLFTSSEARHIALAETLSELAEELCVCTEVRAESAEQVGRGAEPDPVITEYFRRVNVVQQEVFGNPRPFPRDARVLTMRFGALSHTPLERIRPLLDADLFVVFGASYIRDPLISFLTARPAINVHMGVSPFYRGAACNFWAAYDGRADLIGGTIHELTAGLDSGPMLVHAVPAPQQVDPFRLGMLAVKAAHQALASHIRAGDLLTLRRAPQDRSKQIRCARKADFSHAVVQTYLDRVPTAEDVARQMCRRDGTLLHNAFVM